MQSKNNTALLIVLMLVQLLSAIDITIVTLAVPTIANDLHGLSLISLVFSAYMLASTISTPIYGKLSDLYGRKRLLQVGLAIFMVGSITCGISPTMEVLVAARALQGLGAGSMYTLAMTIVGDVFPLEKQARAVGILSTVWSIAGIAGPFVGGLLIDTLGWHWIFFINVPFAIITIAALQLILKEKVVPERHVLDIRGAVILTLAIVVFLVAFIMIDGTDITRDVVLAIAAFIVTFILLVIFYKMEKRAQEPFVPFYVFNKSVTIINLLAFLCSMVLMSLNVYLPIYLQNVQGFSATVSGLIVLSQSVSWCLVALTCGKAMMRYGPKPLLLASNIILLISCAMMLVFNVDTLIIVDVAIIFVSGIAFGGSFTTVTVAVQNASSDKNRGSVMGVMSLMRNLGSTVGIGVFGAIFNICLVGYFQASGAGTIDPNNIYQLASMNPLVSQAQVIDSIMQAVHTQLIALVVLGAIVVVLTAIMPKVSFRKPDAAKG
ncbi:MAG: MFS transporter [Coriobacteriales bacterium]|jgi:EmrB/QacA subfamily drug resistance transporter|nr:MFS transporter [Coriobacteriales bacterium]